MAKFIEFLFMSLIFSFAIFAILGSMQTIHSVNAGNCWEDANGTLQNCSLSNNDFKQLNDTYNMYVQTSSIQNYLMWFLIVGVLVSAVLLFGSLRRN